MKFIKQKIKNLYVIKPRLIKDVRGSFRRSFCLNEFLKKKIKFRCVQINISENIKKGTLRGFHFHKTLKSEPKVITCFKGKLFLCIIDLRKKSSTYKKKVSLILSSKNKQSVHIPFGCANAFLTLENDTIVHYLMGEYYKKKYDSGFNFQSANLKVKWPIKPVVISKKDLNLPEFKQNRIYNN